MVVCKEMVDIIEALLSRRLICGQINHQILARLYCLHSNKVLYKVLNRIMGQW